MQIVNILRNQPRHLAGAVETCERPMAAAGPGPAEFLFHGKTPAPGLIPHLLIRDEGIEGDGLVLGPQTAGGTKVGNPTLSRNPCPGEWDDRLCLLDQIAEPGDCGWKIGSDHRYI